jgi:hypothetical protein
MDRRTREYQSYLLRLWLVRSGAAFPQQEEPVWRASLEDPVCGERLGFANLEGLFSHLRRQTGWASGSLTDEGQRGGDDH